MAGNRMGNRMWQKRLEQFHTSVLWLTPGMGVKRHVSLAILGTLLLTLGALAGLLWIMRSDREVLSAPIEDVLISDTWKSWGGWLALLLLIVGAFLAVEAVARLNRSLLSNWMARPHEAAVVIHRRLALAKGPRIVALGGGSGLSNLLRGLRHYSSNLTAVVSVSDDGGSSGRLRHAFGMPAPGDLVDCLAALSDNEVQVSKLLDYRFTRGGELRGHTFGNLFITTLMEVEGDFAQAIRVLNAMLNICGVVYPVSTEAISLRARKVSGEVVVGESHIREVPGAIRQLSIEPANPKLVSDVALAIANAELIVLGPGSLFTSTLPPLLVPGSRAALLTSPAPIVYVCNVMTEAGETDHFSAWDHVAVLEQHLGRYPDWVVLNRTPVDALRLARYRAENAEEVQVALEPFARAGIQVASLDLLSDGPHAQHDSAVLAKWLVDFAKSYPMHKPIPAVPKSPLEVSSL